MEFFDGMQSENLPHKSGITTIDTTTTPPGLRVGKLAPQIGDYDNSMALLGIGLLMSENLPHKSGITTF